MKIPGIPGQLGLTGPKTNYTDSPEAKSGPVFFIGTKKMTGSDGKEEVQSTRKPNRKVIFYRFGFFTIRVLPRSSHTSLLSLFF